MADKFKPHDFQPLDTSDFQPIDAGLTGEDKDSLSKYIREAPEKVTGIESLLRGGAQSASYGTSDEIEAAARAALDPNEDYAQKLPKVRQDYKTAKESNPGTYLAGEVAGGFAAPGGNAFAAAKGIGGALARIGVGAGLGGFAGVATSDADLTKLNDPKEREKLSGDLKTGAGFGMLGSLGGEALKGAAGIVKNTKLGKRFLEGRQMGLEGINLGSDSDKAEIAQDTLERLQSLSGKIGYDIEDTIKKQAAAVERSGAKVDVDEFLKTLEKDLKSKVGYDSKDQSTLKEMLTTIENFKSGVKIDNGAKKIVSAGPEEIIVKAKKGSKEELQDQAERKVLEAKSLGIDLSYNIKEIKDSAGKPNLVLQYTKREVPEALAEVEAPKIIKTIDGKNNPKAQQKIESHMAQLQSKADFEGKPVKYRTELDEQNGVHRLVEDPVAEGAGMSQMNVDAKATSVPDVPAVEQVTASPIKYQSVPEVLTAPQNPASAEIEKVMRLKKDIARNTYDKEKYSDNLTPTLEQGVGKLSQLINGADPELAKITNKLAQYHKTFENLGIDPRQDKAWVKFSNLVSDLNKSGSMTEAQSQKTLNTFLQDFQQIDSPMKEVLKPELDDIIKKFAISSTAGKEGLSGSLSRLGFTVGGIPAIAGSAAGLAEKSIKDTFVRPLAGDNLATKIGKTGLSAITDGIGAVGSALKQGEFSTKAGAVGKTILADDINKEKGRTTKSISPTADLSKKLYDLPKEDYESVAQILDQDPELKNLADGLRTAQEKNDPYKRNAIMFSLAQNPKARKLLGIGQEGK